MSNFKVPPSETHVYALVITNWK